MLGQPLCHVLPVVLRARCGSPALAGRVSDVERQRRCGVVEAGRGENVSGQRRRQRHISVVGVERSTSACTDEVAAYVSKRTWNAALIVDAAAVART